MTPDQLRGLNVALNEAAILGLEIDPARHLGWATFKVLTLPENGPCPEDRRVQMIFRSVGRVGVGFWRRASAKDPWQVVPVEIDNLLSVVQKLAHLTISGWNFFDIDDDSLQPSDRRPSLDWRSDLGTCRHSLTVSPLDSTSALQLTIWFDSLAINTPTGSPIDIGEFIAGGKRWWDALHAGDPRTAAFGIVAGPASGPANFSCPDCGATLRFLSSGSQIQCAGCGSIFRAEHHA